MQDNPIHLSYGRSRAMDMTRLCRRHLVLENGCYPPSDLVQQSRRHLQPQPLLQRWHQPRLRHYWLLRMTLILIVFLRPEGKKQEEKPRHVQQQQKLAHAQAR